MLTSPLDFLSINTSSLHSCFSELLACEAFTREHVCKSLKISGCEWTVISFFNLRTICIELCKNHNQRCHNSWPFSQQLYSAWFSQGISICPTFNQIVLSPRNFRSSFKLNIDFPTQLLIIYQLNSVCGIQHFQVSRKFFYPSQWPCFNDL